MKDIQKIMKEFMLERGWEKQLPADVAKSIVIEAAELLEHFQWSNPLSESIKKDPEKVAEIRKELADVFIYLFQMAILIDADVENIIKKKLAISAKKYPAHVLGKSPYDTEVQEKYWKIKKEHRKTK